MTGPMDPLRKTEDFYFFGSRIATHVFFWMAYYLFFSLIWATDEGYLASFYLEFILLPARMLAVYVTLYFLLPRFLLQRAYFRFLLGYGLTLLLAGILQRVFIHLFYENLLLEDSSESLFSLRMLMRAIMLINTTVFFVLGIKLFQLWVVAYEELQEPEAGDTIELRANRRVHRVVLKDILYVEGLGNYVNYFMADGTKITSYGSVKKAQELLPDNFVRVHKSYLVNKARIKSYDASNIQVSDRTVPRGKGVSDEMLTP